MAFVTVPAAVIPLTGDGDATGHVTISVLTFLLPHTKVNLFSAGAGSLPCEVVSFDDSTGKVALRVLPLTKTDPKQLRYGWAGDLSAWTVVGVSTLQVELQIVPVDPLYRAKV